MSKTPDLYAVILAGGSGSRLWPLSREMYPKQLLRLNNQNTLFQSTFLRLAKNFSSSNIVTTTNIKHAADIKLQLSELEQVLGGTHKPRVIVEPVGKNTAPAIALSVFYILNKMCKKGEDPIILIAPSDHLVKFQDKFADAVNKGVKLAKAGFIVTFGIKPEKPDTGFGYIKTIKDNNIAKITDNALKVQKFKEKPNLAMAEEYCRQGTYFWNSGIFMFRASTILNEMELYSKDIIKGLSDCDIADTGPAIKYDDYIKLPEISIDYAVMEYSKLITLIPVECGWSDMGSWQAIYDISDKDERNNFISGNVFDIDSKNSLIYSTSKLVSTIGLKDTVIIETDDAILACDKSRTQEVKKIFDHLKINNDLACMVHSTVYKHWGYNTALQRGKGFLIKTLHINPYAGLTFQMHHHRSEHWVVLSGTAKVTKENEIIYLNPGDSIDIPALTKHSIVNETSEELNVIEIQTGTSFEDDDIIRFENNTDLQFDQEKY